MNKILIATTALCVTALSGCASTSARYEPVAYRNRPQPRFSIAEAGGLKQGFRMRLFTRSVGEADRHQNLWGRLCALWLYLPERRWVIRLAGRAGQFGCWAMVAPSSMEPATTCSLGCLQAKLHLQRTLKINLFHM